MRSLVQELIPHAPKLGLYVAPDIPPDKVTNAIRDYATGLTIPDVLALYDGTLLGSAKDGILFYAEGIVFQNNDLQQPEEIRYEDIVRVNTRRKLLGGRRLLLDVNRGRATVEVELDFSARPDAAEHVAKFLSEAMLQGVDFGRGPAVPESSAALTDVKAVQEALDALVQSGRLTPQDRGRMLDQLS